MKQLLYSLAATINPEEIGLNNPAKDPNAVMANTLTTVYIWAGIICVMVIIIAGIFYSVSAGNPNQTTRAREAIQYALVGVLVVMMAFVITQFVLGRF